MTRVILIGLVTLSAAATDSSAIAQSKPPRRLLQSEILDVEGAPPSSVDASIKMLRFDLRCSQEVGDFRKTFQRKEYALEVRGSAEAIANVLRQVPRESALPILSLLITGDTNAAVCEVLEDSRLRPRELHVSCHTLGDRLIKAIIDVASVERAILRDVTVTSHVLANFLGSKTLSTVVIGDSVEIEPVRGSAGRLSQFGLPELVVYTNSSTVEFLERAVADAALLRIRRLSIRGDSKSDFLTRVVGACEGLVRFDFQSKEPTVHLLWNLQKCEKLRVVVVRCHNRLADGAVRLIDEFAIQRLDVRVIVENREPPWIFSAGDDVEVRKIGVEAMEWPIWSARALTLRGAHPSLGVGKGSFRVLGR